MPGIENFQKPTMPSPTDETSVSQERKVIAEAFTKKLQDAELWRTTRVQLPHKSFPNDIRETEEGIPVYSISTLLDAVNTLASLSGMDAQPFLFEKDLDRIYPASLRG